MGLDTSPTQCFTCGLSSTRPESLDVPYPVCALFVELRMWPKTPRLPSPPKHIHIPIPIPHTYPRKHQPATPPTRTLSLSLHPPHSTVGFLSSQPPGCSSRRTCSNTSVRSKQWSRIVDVNTQHELSISKDVVDSKAGGRFGGGGCLFIDVVTM